MREVINEKVSVICRYDREQGRVEPVRLKWQGRIRNLTKQAYYYKKRVGRTMLHVFHVGDEVLDYCLQWDSETMHWTLLEISDGNGN